MSTAAELEPADPADEGGPRQSFWAHLEDLRKAIIRSCVAIGLAMVVCMVFTNQIVTILVYPLKRIDMFEKPKPTVSFKIGATKFGPFPVSREQFPALPTGPAPQAVFQVGSSVIGRDQVATLKLLPPTTTPAGSNALGVHLVNFGPAEGFVGAFHIALFAALIVSAPFWIYFMVSFIMPALHKREREALTPWIAWSVVLFLLGVLSTYFVLLPVALRAGVMYSNWLGFDAYTWRADDYISFVTHFMIGMGLGFQFPIVILFLVKLGILGYRQLAKYRRHVCVLSFILGALLTTPDVVTQVAMAVPLYLLYEICIWIAWYWEQKKKKAALANAVE
ncbi:MAG TPA: twin-arginine translocase subunit TatC [Opitutaceae bacterium]|nr:twin-arginine translocase subunit TatC [Opitutaceae bacterium]